MVEKGSKTEAENDIIMPNDSPKRMSVNLDEEESAMLEKLHRDFDISRSKVFTKALKFLYEINAKNIDSETIFDHLHLLNERKHLAINKEMIQAMGEELNSGNEAIKEKFFDIGSFYFREFREMGLKSVEEILLHLEKHNWFRTIKKDEGKFTLDLRVRKSCHLLKSFLKGVFEQSPHRVQLEDIRGKLLLTETK